MSNAIRYDSLLVRELARELNGALAGARLSALRLDRERLRVAILAEPARRADAEPPSLIWQLHPDSGHITRAAPASGAARVDAHGRAVAQRVRAPIVAVTSPPDERVLIIELDAGDAPAGAARRIVVELVTNQWNVIATGEGERIISVLRERQTRDRTLRVGEQYVPPRPSDRAGAATTLDLHTWSSLLDPVPPAERLAALTRAIAWTSPLNAAWILGRAGVVASPDALAEAHTRYTVLVDADRLQPVLIEEAGRWQPYVSAAAGPEHEPMPALLTAFEQAATGAAAAPPPDAAVEDALAAIAQRLDAVESRMRRLREEEAGAAAEAARLRRQADLLLSQLHTVTRGAATARLDDYAGGTIDVELDPTLNAADNAKAMYDTARRRDRAAARIPRLLTAARTERERLEALAARVREGTAEPADLQRLARRTAATRDAAPALPYRLYRSTGGLEIRVGRGARANDELTFRHSSPNDVWLHARDVAGAHVVVRWNRTDANPPARDIEEAAVLAALYSRARTSGTVPVDWTRRKYVRKPRRAAPGLVLPERVRTIFVSPDASLEERLRVDDLI